MTVRKIKGNSRPFCSFCASTKTRAVWRSTNIRDAFACQHHEDDLKAEDAAQAKLDSHMSEGEWQAYGRMGY